MLAAVETERRIALLKRFLAIVGIAAAAIQASLSRNYLSSPDGVSYLDIADSYLRGDWHSAVNAYWSPLYSWLLAAVLFIFKPSGQNEFAVVKVVNFLAFLLALGC